VENDSVRLNPAFVTRARVALPDRAGSYRLEGRDERGTVLFGYDFEPAEIDHAPDVRHFTFAIPLAEGARLALSRIRVVHGARSSELRARSQLMSRPPAATTPSAATNVSRVGPGQLEVRWDRVVYGAVMVRDPVSGRVLGIGTSGRLHIPSGGSSIDVELSDGVRSSRTRLSAPEK